MNVHHLDDDERSLALQRLPDGDRHQEVAGLDLCPGLDAEFIYLTVVFGDHSRLHLHCFEQQELLTLLDRVAGSDGDLNDHPRHAGADMTRILRIGPPPLLLGRLHRAIDDRHFPGLTVEFEEHRAPTVSVRFAHREETDDERLARFDVDSDLLARLESIPERRRRQDACVRVLPLMLAEVFENLWIKQVGDDVAARRFPLEPRTHRLFCLVEVGWR